VLTGRRVIPGGVVLWVAVLGTLAGVVLSSVLWVRLNNAQNKVKTLEATTASLRASKAIQERMYTQGIENLTTELSEAHSRIQEYSEAIRNTPEAAEWANQKIPKEVRDALRVD